MQADFDLMRHALEEAHPGLYRYSTKAEMDRGFDAQRAKLGRPLAKGEFEAVVAGCAQRHAGRPDDLSRNGNRRN